jgi:hypothetical protein
MEVDPMPTPMVKKTASIMERSTFLLNLRRRTRAEKRGDLGLRIECI